MRNLLELKPNKPRLIGIYSLQGDVMRKWFLPLTVLGLGSLGVLVATERGRGVLRQVGKSLDRAPDQLRDWSDAFDGELAKIQTTLDSLNDLLAKPEKNA
jgi:hypothetical protein